jgi:DNA-binding SARP family transcriptional activator
VVTLEFRILGQPEVYCDGVRLDPGPPRQQSVLAALLLHRDETICTARLAEAVWWQPPRAAAANLRVYLAGIRRLLREPDGRGSRVQTVRGGGYRLRVLSGELDLDRFGDLATAGDQALRDGHLAVAADRLERAVRMWRGRALGATDYGPGVGQQITQLEERRLAVTERWARTRLALGHGEDLIADLRGLVVDHPLREPLWACLILALHSTGRAAEALAAYADARTVLADELGADPGPELRRLYGQVLRGEDPVAARRPRVRNHSGRWTR